MTRDTSSPLAGRTVLVTGASSGIGEATAYAVASRGAIVHLLARRGTELQRVREAIEVAGGVAVVHICDLTDAGAVDALSSDLVQQHGGVDYLVNNAGRSIRRSVELSYDRFHDVERTMAINFFGAVRLTLGLLPAMRERGFGHIVNITSWGVQKKQPKFSAYLASKSALDTWGRVVGRETYRDGVTFTSVRFGLVMTPMVEGVPGVHHRRSISPAVAAAVVVKALEERPITVGQPGGFFFGVLNVVAPRASDAWMSRQHLASPDSPAARSPSLEDDPRVALRPPGSEIGNAVGSPAGTARNANPAR